MNGAFYVGAMGLHAQQNALDIVASNITNMNTPGYKRAEARFSEMLTAPAPDAPERRSMTGAAALTLMPTAHLFTQGDLRPTGRSLDIAIDGEGFIELLGQNGRTELWRGGTLKVNSDGFLAAANGLVLKSMISVPDGATDVTIGRDGIVAATAPGDGEPREIGRIDLVRVRDTDQLESLGGGTYAASSDPTNLVSIEAGDEGGAIVQGAIEGSNVVLTDEMVTLLMMQRAYAASAQVVQAGDQLMSIANSLRRI